MAIWYFMAFWYFLRPFDIFMAIWYFMATWYFFGYLIFLWPFGIFCGHLVYFVVIW
jgi:hypothetical protein